MGDPAGSVRRLSDRLLRHLSRRRPGWPYLAGAPLLIAHRGGAALAPENTLLAFDRALRWWGADLLELDVHATRDRTPVVIHDGWVDRTTSGTGPVAGFTLSELQALDAGYRFSPDQGSSFPFRGRGISVPTLAQVLANFPRTRINIEVKDWRAQEPIRDAVRSARAEGRVLIAGEQLANQSELRRSLPAPSSAARREVLPFYLLHRVRLAHLYRPSTDAFQIPIRLRTRLVPTRRLVRDAHALNVAVHVWTVDEAAEMGELLENGVDGIVTDRPDRLARVLHERVGRPLPAGPDPTEAEPFLGALLTRG